MGKARPYRHLYRVSVASPHQILQPCADGREIQHTETPETHETLPPKGIRRGTHKGHRSGIYKDPWRKKHHHHHHLHQYLHIFHILIVINSTIPRGKLLIHPYVYHSYHHYDVDCLHV
jgi:hypothetical protein